VVLIVYSVVFALVITAGNTAVITGSREIGIEFMPETEFGKSNKWLTVILITPEAFGADREQVRLALEAENIESRPVWKPMHLQPVFHISDYKNQSKKEKPRNGVKRYKARRIHGEVAEDLFDRGLCLPSGTAMTDQDLDRVISVIKKCQNRSADYAD